MKQSINFQQNSSLKETETIRFYLVMDTMWRLSGGVEVKGEYMKTKQVDDNGRVYESAVIHVKKR